MSYTVRSAVTHARYNGVTLPVSASTTSARTAAGIGSQIRLVRVYNPTAAIAFISTGDATVEATMGDLPLAPGLTEYFIVNPGERLAAILASGTGTVYVSEMTA